MDVSHEADCAQVVHKERGKEKGKSPHTPLKEKESQKEISPSPSPYPSPRERACAGAQGEPSGKGKGQGKVDILDRSIEIRPRVTIHVNDEYIRYSECDSVEIAMAILRLPKIETYKGMTFNNPRILRKIRSQIGDEIFKELIIRQWHENAIDGEPRNRAAAFMAKLYAVRDEIAAAKGGAA